MGDDEGKVQVRGSKCCRHRSLVVFREKVSLSGVRV